MFRNRSQNVNQLVLFRGEQDSSDVIPLLHAFLWIMSCFFQIIEKGTFPGSPGTKF